MQNAENLIQIYHTASFISLILGILLLALSLLLFFKFDILKIFDMKTGRGARRTIQRMEEMNALTGKLRDDPSVGFTAPSGNADSRITYPVTSQNPKIQEEARLKAQTPPPSPEPISRPTSIDQASQAAALHCSEQGSEDTNILYESPETTLLYEEPGTTVLSVKDKLSEEKSRVFRIEKEIMLIHTQEAV